MWRHGKSGKQNAKLWTCEGLVWKTKVSFRWSWLAAAAIAQMLETSETTKQTMLLSLVSENNNVVWKIDVSIYSFRVIMIIDQYDEN